MKAKSTARIAGAFWNIATKQAYYYEDNFPSKYVYVGRVAPKDLSKANVDVYFVVSRSAV